MLHVWLPIQQGHLYIWLDNQGEWQAHENWQSVSEHVVGRQVCLYFPSQHVLQVESDLSATQLKQLGHSGRQYLFDEMALSNVEQLVIRQMAGDSSQYLYAIANNDIEQWKQSASLSGFNIQYLLPDFLLVEAAQENGKVNLYYDDYTTLIRFSEANGMAVSYLPLVLEKLDSVEEIQVFETVGSVEGDELSSSNNLNNLLTMLDERNILYNHSPKHLHPVEKFSRHALNFMVKESKSSFSPYIKTVLIVGILALILQIISDGLSWNQYKQAATSTTQATKQQFKAWFPERQLNSKTKLQTQLEPMLMTSRSSSSSGLSVLQQISPLIKQSQVTALGLLIEGNSIKLQLVANSRGELDQLVEKLTQQGIDAQLGSVNTFSSDNPSLPPMNNNGQNDKRLMGELTILTPSPSVSSDS